jgi:hypothetical protein
LMNGLAGKVTAMRFGNGIIPPEKDWNLRANARRGVSLSFCDEPNQAVSLAAAADQPMRDSR